MNSRGRGGQLTQETEEGDELDSIGVDVTPGF
jgi:hypothetical protein